MKIDFVYEKISTVPRFAWKQRPEVIRKRPVGIGEGRRMCFIKRNGDEPFAGSKENFCRTTTTFICTAL